MKNNYLLGLLTVLMGVSIVGCSFSKTNLKDELANIDLGKKVDSVSINGKLITSSSTFKDIGYLCFNNESAYLEIDQGDNIYKKSVLSSDFSINTMKMGNYSETTKSVSGIDNGVAYNGFLYDISDKIQYGFIMKDNSTYVSENSNKKNPMTYDDKNEKILKEVNKKPANFNEEIQYGSIYSYLRRNGAIMLNLFEKDLANNQSIKIETYQKYTKVSYHNDFGVLFDPSLDAFIGSRTYSYEKALEFAKKAINNNNYYVNSDYYINNTTGNIDYAYGDFSGLFLNSTEELTGKSSWVFKVLSEDEQNNYKQEKEEAYQYALKNFTVKIG